MTARAYILSGPVILGNLIKFLQSLPLSKPWEITIRPHVKRKTDSQRSVMHIAIRALARELGYTEREMKELVKQEFGPKLEVLGKSIPKPTEQYSTQESADMTEQIHRIAAEQGVFLQDSRVIS